VAGGSRVPKRRHAGGRVDTLPALPKDAPNSATGPDRSPTGNRFESRVGSSQAIAGPQEVNTIVANRWLHGRRTGEGTQAAAMFNEGRAKLLQKVLKEHGRVILHRDNYSQEWHDDAARRSADTRTTHEALVAMACEVTFGFRKRTMCSAARRRRAL
jgi:glutamine synthetase